MTRAERTRLAIVGPALDRSVAAGGHRSACRRAPGRRQRCVRRARAASHGGRAPDPRRPARAARGDARRAGRARRRAPNAAARAERAAGGRARSRSGCARSIGLLLLANPVWFLTGFHTIFFEGSSWRFDDQETLRRLFPDLFWSDTTLLLGVGAALQAARGTRRDVVVVTKTGLSPAAPRTTVGRRWRDGRRTALYAEIDLELSWSEDELPQVERTKHVHGLHPVPGQVRPAARRGLPPPLLHARGAASTTRSSGSGTTLVEANVFGADAIGCDISAFNCLLTRGEDGALLARRARAGPARRARRGAAASPRRAASDAVARASGSRRARSTSCSPTARPSRGCRSRTPRSGA